MAVTLALLAACLLAASSASAAQTQTFTSAGSTMNPAVTTTPGTTATPFPATLDVSGMHGAITNVTATLNGINFSDLSVDVALQSPHGESVMLTSDEFLNESNGTLPFADSGAPQPPTDPTGATVYQPANNNPPSNTDFSDPAPTNPGTAFSALDGQDANGTWKLWVEDGADEVSGNITNWTVTITTTGLPGASVTPASLDFGTVVPPAAAAPQTVTFTNSGDGTLTFSQAAAVTGANASDFPVSSNSCSGTLAPGANCSVAVGFAPVTDGAKSAALTFTDDASGSPQSVPLSGTAAIGSPPPGPSGPQQSGSPNITVQSASFQSAIVGQPTYLNLTASDPKEQVTGLLVDFGETLGAYGESACVKGRNKPGTTSFHVPYVFRNPGDHTIKVTIFAGGCGRPVAHTYIFTVHVAPPGTTARLAAHAAQEVTLTGPPITSRCKNNAMAPSQAKTKLVIKTLLCVMNEQRKLYKLKPLKLSPRLGKAALAHSRAMILGKFFAHQGPRELGLVQRLARVKYHGYAAENIGAGAGPLGTPLAMVDGWMHSSLHRANLLTKRWKFVGVGFLAQFPIPTTGSPSATYTTDFGSKP